MIYLVLAIPLAIVWMAISNRIALDSFAVGYVFGVAVIVLVRPPRGLVRVERLPDQLLALVTYLATLIGDVTLSGISVTRRVLSRDMRLRLGIVALPTFDSEANPIICALTADAITLTPGELVVETEDNTVLYVHSLDVEATLATVPDVQVRRLKLLYRMMGREMR
jgi:multicomponent Na+:H+ antiporter subunit E